MESLNMSNLNVSSADSTSEPAAAPSPQYKALPPEGDSIFYRGYTEDNWSILLQQDAEKPMIHLQSPQLEFRGTLVNQLRKASQQLGMSLATLHTAVAQLDLFMDGHRLRADRLTHIALACLSVAAKTGEMLGQAPSLTALSAISGTHLCGKTFRQLEWMVGQHVQWRLLAPTPVTFATHLAQYVVTNQDVVTRHPKFMRRIKKDGAKLLDAYLDLTLSDVRLKVVEAADVGSACVACARADLGFCAWPPALAEAAGRQHSVVASIARRLLRMMQMLKSREVIVDPEVDQGYSSAATSPVPTPLSSPGGAGGPAATSHGCQDKCLHLVDPTCLVLELDSSDPSPNKAKNAPGFASMDTSFYGSESTEDLRYARSYRLINTCFDSEEPLPSKAVKRSLEPNEESDCKRYRHTAQGIL